MSSSTYHHHRQSTCAGMARRGFTLVELLVVIAIIGILVGLLLVVASGAVKRAQEFAISTEITQMDQSLEKFKTDYGFYPPSPVRNMNLAQLRTALVRIAPTHRQTDAQLMDWMSQVGQNLDENSSLVFWLSGLAANKQFPLTDPVSGNPLPAFDDGSVSNGGSGIDRQNFFDFKTAQLVGAGLIRDYKMPHGKRNGDLNYVYVDASSYASASSTPYQLPNGSFVNPNRFQLFSAGLDGDFGVGSSGNVQAQLPGAADNLCNFSASSGRLDRFVTENVN